jgi:hypothetical protein
MSPEAFTAWSEWAKYAHNYPSVPFAFGVVFIFLTWFIGNIPNRVDVEWFKRGGGMFNHDHPPGTTLQRRPENGPLGRSANIAAPPFRSGGRSEFPESNRKKLYARFARQGRPLGSEISRRLARGVCT